MVELGLIGKSLKHSFSKAYFDEKFKEMGLTNYSYQNFEIHSVSDFTKIISEHPELTGLNVTIPYKESIISFLDELSSDVREIGAVNCIHIKNGKKTGYNTDAYGFGQSIKPFLDTNHERALILGSGGASKAVAYALKKVGVDVYFVTSSAQKKTSNSFFYSEINELVLNAFKLVVNTTPLGTSPNEKESPPLPYQFFTPNHLAYDLVYNPAETEFLRKAKSSGAVTMNGLSMLKLQAEKSWEIWQK